MAVTQGQVAQARKGLEADFYRFKGWPFPKGFGEFSPVFGTVAVRMMVRINKLLLPEHDPNVWDRQTTQAILRAMAPPVTPLSVAKTFLGPIETLGNNLGPKVAQVQMVTDLAPGNWPYCAAGVFFCAKEAGWDHENQFRLEELEAWVPGWVQAARNREHGLMVVSDPQPNDAIAFDWAGRGGVSTNFDHIGLVRGVVRDANGRITHVLTREFNTGPGEGGNQSDGDGCWDRVRPMNDGILFIRFTGEDWR